MTGSVLKSHSVSGYFSNEEKEARRLEANITQLDLGKPGLEWQMHLQSPPVFPLCPERSQEMRVEKAKFRENESWEKETET